MGVELGGLVVDGVYYHEPGRGGLPGGDSLAERFGEQQPANALPCSLRSTASLANRTMPMG